jgi:hypothetical protein
VQTVRRIDSLGPCLVLFLGAVNPPLVASGSGEQSEAAPSLIFAVRWGNK